MKDKRGIIMVTLVAMALLIGYATIAVAAENAFSILEKVEKQYVGLEKPGLETLTAKAKCSMVPEATILIYWAKGKGLKTKIEGGGPMAGAAKQMVEAYMKIAGLGIQKSSERYKLTPENFTGTVEPATIAGGTKVSQLTFIPKEGKSAEFTKMMLMVDTKAWVIRQVKTIAPAGETVSEFEYQDSLITKLTTGTSEMKSTITNTYTTADKFTVPAKTGMAMNGKNVPANMQHMTITYSDFKINAEIPEEIFAAPKAGDLPKPTETAAELFQQTQAAMQKGDMETAKLKLRQIITYYPDDPMAGPAKMMLKQLPK